MTTSEIDAGLDADRRWIAASLPGIAPHTVQGILPRLVGRELREPAVGQTPHSLDNRLGPPA